ncbi:hypothetical protein JNK62_00235 [bacterium]|nr:hypothetical protein [bacterium]
MATLGFILALFGATLFLTASQKVVMFSRQLKPGTYDESWGMWPSWFEKARQEGWLRRGRDRNIRSALKGLAMLAIGLVCWRFIVLDKTGQTVLVAISSVTMFLGYVFIAMEDRYSVACRTMITAGMLGWVSVVIMHTALSALTMH